ncbi:DUF4279 domain-containing protein [Luteibacter flocculans]|uniref:DUF4279 domain-containing protein n=1 Tax=Luteibacter flocculans TaxID=2780091 RepID=A0ABY4TAV8_9GAMM|nr:DUF4279 domain-containing protein [Luteibacter flocculans]URL59851.1 DUF4279 domain-containing protein [Luteibacter flocculans]
MPDYMYISLSLGNTTTPPREISAATGIEPSTALLKGERDPVRVLPRSNLWSIESMKSPQGSLEACWQELEHKLLPRTDIFRHFAAEGSAVLTIAIQGMDGRIPSIMIPPSMSLFAGTIGAVIDIDHLLSAD